jgi:hypothetical protein
MSTRQRKNKIAMIEKLIDEVESFGVFGKTKITDLVLQK